MIELRPEKKKIKVRTTSVRTAVMAEACRSLLNELCCPVSHRSAHVFVKSASAERASYSPNHNSGKNFKKYRHLALYIFFLWQLLRTTTKMISADTKHFLAALILWWAAS